MAKTEVPTQLKSPSKRKQQLTERTDLDLDLACEPVTGGIAFYGGKKVPFAEIESKLVTLDSGRRQCPSCPALENF